MTGEARVAALTLTVVALSNLLLAWDLTGIAIALPALDAAFDPSASLLMWLQNAFPLALAACAPLASFPARRIGIRRTFAVAAALMALGAGITAAAAGSYVFLLGRLLLGAASAVAVAAGLALLTETRDAAALSRAIGVTTAFTAIGLALGPLASGLVIDLLSWRGVFAVHAALAVVILAVSVPLLRAARRDGEQASSTSSSVALLLSTAILTGTVGLQTLAELPILGGALVAAAAATLACFTVAERRVRAPFIPRGLRGSRAFVATLAIGALVYAAVSASQPFQSLLLQRAGWSPTATGLFLVAVTGGIAVGSGISSWVVSRVGVRSTVVFGLALSATGTALLIGTSAEPLGLALAAAGNLVSGVGVGIASPQALSWGMSAAEEPSTTAPAATAQTTARRAGSSYGYALFSLLPAFGMSMSTATPVMFAAATVLMLVALLAALRSRVGAGVTDARDTRSAGSGPSPA